MLIHTQPATLKSEFREVFDNYEDIFTLVNVLYLQFHVGFLFFKELHQLTPLKTNTEMVP